MNPIDKTSLSEEGAWFANTKKKLPLSWSSRAPYPHIHPNRELPSFKAKKNVEERLRKLIIVEEEPEDITAVDDDMYKQLSAQCRKADEARVRKRQHK